MLSKPTRGNGLRESCRFHRRLPRLVQVLALAACAAVTGFWLVTVARDCSASIWRASPQPFLSPYHKPTLPLATDKRA